MNAHVSIGLDSCGFAVSDLVSIHDENMTNKQTVTWSRYWFISSRHSLDTYAQCVFHFNSILLGHNKESNKSFTSYIYLGVADPQADKQRAPPHKGGLAPWEP